jgi:transposase-like protein
MLKSTSRVFDREFKLTAIRRMMAGENVSALARELRLRRKLLYAWRDQFRRGGPEALRVRGRPRKTLAPPAAVEAAPASPPMDRAPNRRQEPAAELVSARQRVAELERKVGQQQLELDFFRRALRRYSAEHQPSDGSGVAPSTPRSRR